MKDSPSAPMTFSIEVEPSVETVPPAAAVLLSSAFWPQPANSESAMTAMHKMVMIFFKMKCSFQTSILILVFCSLRFTG